MVTALVGLTSSLRDDSPRRIKKPCHSFLSEIKLSIITFQARRLAIVISAALLMFGGRGGAAVFYVKTNGNDSLSGASWALAKRSITNSMATVAPGDQIWVASGIYTQLVTLKAGVALYGGFNGTETALNQRDWRTNVSWIYGASSGTVLSINTGSGPDTRLDGMGITGGSGIFGGGISCDGSAAVIANNFIFANAAPGGIGGGIYINFHLTTPLSDPIVTNNLIYQNSTLGSIGEGAGITVRNSSPLIAWNRVLFNVAGDKAGGIACFGNCHALIANNVIEANASCVDSIGLGGGILATYDDYDGQPVNFAISDPIIVNNIVAANGADSGGGIALVDAPVNINAPWGAATVVNNTIVGNTGSGIFWANTYPTNYNNLVAFNSAGLETSDGSPVVLFNNDVYSNNVLAAATDYIGLSNATGARGNISADPVLANYRIGDFHLQPNSPCVDAGLTAVLVPGWPDAGGSNRLVGAAVDIGAYESTGKTLSVPTPIIHVSPSGTNTNDGFTWATAKQTLRAAIAAAAPHVAQGGEVWVAQGTYAEHVSIPAFVYLYGGFAGTETNRANRGFSAHPTIVDGGGKPTVVESLSAGYLVSTLDGFTVQNGGVYTDGQSFTGSPEVPGGGVLCQVSAPILANNIIRSNSVGTPFNSNGTSKGGGIYLYVSHAQISNNTITHNDVLDHTAGTGGGIYALRSKPSISQNVLFWNHAVYGPAITADLDCSLRLTGNNIVSNFFYGSAAPYYYGAFYGTVLLTGCNGFFIDGNTFLGNWTDAGSGLYIAASDNGTVQNNVFNGNLAYALDSQTGMGGGIYCEIDGVIGNVKIVNNTFFNNRAPSPVLIDMGGAIALNLLTNSVVLANNIIVSNSGGIWLRSGQPPATYRNNCVLNPINYSGLVSFGPGVGDIHLDPKFTNSAAGDFHLLGNSPCIDAGTSLFAPLTDKDGTPRPLDGKNSGTAAFDIGAYEYVNPSADTDHDGMPDWAELIAGTDPTNPNSVLRLQASAPAAPGPILLSWLSVVGRAYSIEFKSSFADANWQTLTNNLPGTGAPLQIQDPLNISPGRVYRLGVIKQP